MARRTSRMIGICAIASIVVTALVSAACGGSSSPARTATSAPTTKPEVPTSGPAPTESEAEQTIGVSLAEWTITATGGAPIGPVKAGEIKFDVHNLGTTQHEFVVIKTDADPAALPVEDSKVNEESAGDSPGEADDIDPGAAKVATMRLDRGNYVFICNVPGHYQSGMRGKFTVE